MDIEALLREQRDFFDSGKTLDIRYRLAGLSNLEWAVEVYESRLCEALMEDLDADD